MKNKKLKQRHMKLAKLTEISSQLAECLIHLHTMSKYIPKKNESVIKKFDSKGPPNMRQHARNRSCCVIEQHLDREETGYFVSVFQHIRQHDPKEFFNHTRMNQAAYDFLLSMMDQSQLLTKHSIRRPFSPEFRLAITIHYLAENLNTKFISEKYKIGFSTVRDIIKETSESLWQALAPIYVTDPQYSEYKENCNGFYNKWYIPNCVGALDGRYIQIKCPTTRKETKYNSRNEYSTALLATCNSNYEFSFVNIATHQKGTKKEFFDAINFSKHIINKQNELLSDKPFPKRSSYNPHYFVTNANFPVNNEQIIKPYTGTNLTGAEQCTNKRIQPAIDTIDNAFGILVARWKILQNCFHLIPETAEKLILCCVALHNFILHSSNNVPEYCPPKFADWYDKNMKKHPGEWRRIVQDNFLQPIEDIHMYSQLEKDTSLRGELKDYFNNQ